MTEMDFSTNSFVRSCSLDCELKPVDVVSDKNRFEKARSSSESFTCRCSVCDRKLSWASLVAFFGGVLQTFSDSVMTSLIKIFLMDQFRFLVAVCLFFNSLHPNIS